MDYLSCSPKKHLEIHSRSCGHHPLHHHVKVHELAYNVDVIWHVWTDLWSAETWPVNIISLCLDCWFPYIDLKAVLQSASGVRLTIVEVKWAEFSASTWTNQPHLICSLPEAFVEKVLNVKQTRPEISVSLPRGRVSTINTIEVQD